MSRRIAALDDDRRPGPHLGVGEPLRPGGFPADSSGVTLADPRVRSNILRLAEDNNKLHEVITEIVRTSGESYDEVLGGVLAVIDATREREALDESQCDPERLALADRVQVRALREHITMSEAIDREGLK